MVWIDHLNAILVGTVVLMLGVGLIVLRSGGAREDVQVYAGEAARDGVVSQLEIDFENMGAGLLAGETAVLSHDSTHVTFRSVADTLGTPALIRYRLTPTGSVGSTPLYRIERSVNGVASGGSNSQIVTFDLTFRDASGAETVSTSRVVRAVDVWVQWALPFGAENGAHLQRASWGSTIHPAPLRLAN